jgi:hypothetical protein
MNTEETTEATDNTPPPSPHKITARNIKRELPCKLTDAQLLEVATVKADLEAELDELQDQFADVKRDWGKRLEETEKRIDHLGGELRARARKSVVICHDRIDAVTRMVETIREDTGEVVDRRVANLFEAGQVLPQTQHTKGDEIAAPGDEDDDSVDDSLAAAAADAQRAAGIEETEDGDVVARETAAPKTKRSKKK